MRGGPLRAAAGLLACLAVAGCAHGASVQGASVGSSHRPSIVIASYFPLTVEGRHFRPDEKIVVEARPHQAGVKPVYVRGHVRSDGAFTVRLHGRGLDRCTGFTITATGSSGNRASIRSAAYACPPVPGSSAPS
jgi:hypothetical protein